VTPRKEAPVESFDLDHLEFSRFRAVLGETLRMVVTRLDEDLVADNGEHAHEELFLVLDGEMEIQEGGDRRVLHKGQGALVSRSADHRETFRAGCRVLQVAVQEPSEPDAGSRVG
jgi:quercetin dioxygenase-like cupin family protein